MAYFNNFVGHQRKKIDENLRNQHTKAKHIWQIVNWGQSLEEDNEAVLNQIPQSERPGVQAVHQHILERVRRIRSISSDGAHQGPSQRVSEAELRLSHVNEVVDSEETNCNSPQCYNCFSCQ